MELKLKKLRPTAALPAYASAGAGAFDLRACFEDNHPVYVSPGAPVSIPTGLAVEVPDGYTMLIFSRSGHGFNFDVRLANCVGVIDSDYRGEVMVKMTNDGVGPALAVNNGDRIAQALLVATPRVELVWADGLSETGRGANGFGSTGA